jgi:receptor protein-tyrosine kinase
VAIIMAQAGKKVILVDANLRRPSLGALFSLTGKAGLTTTLRERGDQARALDEALQPAMVPNLQVLISGPQPPNPAELLSSESMTRVLRELEARADLVIFDTPHMGPLADAVVLSARASGTLLVIRAGSTRRTVITNSLNALRKVGSNVVGTVLNMADMKASTRHSYYDYQTYTSATAKAATSGGTRGT